MPVIPSIADQQHHKTQQHKDAANLIAHIQQRLASAGVIRITKNSGMFVALV